MITTTIRTKLPTRKRFETEEVVATHFGDEEENAAFEAQKGMDRTMRDLEKAQRRLVEEMHFNRDPKIRANALNKDSFGFHPSLIPMMINQAIKDATEVRENRRK